MLQDLQTNYSCTTSRVTVAGKNDVVNIECEVMSKEVAQALLDFVDKFHKNIDEFSCCLKNGNHQAEIIPIINKCENLRRSSRRLALFIRLRSTIRQCNYLRVVVDHNVMEMIRIVSIILVLASDTVKAYTEP